jgi:hypothetical protein
MIWLVVGLSVCHLITALVSVTDAIATFNISGNRLSAGLRTIVSGWDACGCDNVSDTAGIPTWLTTK